jgi:hypothetical protein
MAGHIARLRRRYSTVNVSSDIGRRALGLAVRFFSLAADDNPGYDLPSRILEARRRPRYTPTMWPIRSSTPLSEHSPLRPHEERAMNGTATDA